MTSGPDMCSIQSAYQFAFLAGSCRASTEVSNNIQPPSICVQQNCFYFLHVFLNSFLLDVCGRSLDFEGSFWESFLMIREQSGKTGKLCSGTVRLASQALTNDIPNCSP